MNHPWQRAGEALAHILAQENAALTALDLPAAVALLAEKTKQAAAFDSECPDAVPREQAVELLTRLTALAHENRRLLDRGIKAQVSVIGVLAGLMRHTPRMPRYGAQGTLRSARAPLTLTLSSEA